MAVTEEKNSAKSRESTGKNSGKKSFIERNIKEMHDFLIYTLYAEAYARKQGLLQRMDARAKIIFIFLFLAFISFMKSFGIIFAFYIFSLFLAYFSGINLREFVTRTWFFIPFFAGIIALPNLFILSQGERALLRFNFLGIALGLSYGNIASYATFVLRVATGVSFSVLLILTTSFNELIFALKKLRLPQSVVLIFSIAWRYIFVFLISATDIYMARKSRSIGKSGERMERDFITRSIAMLFRKSYKLTEEVYLAMVSRGYGG